MSYAILSDLTQYGLPAQALANFPTAEQQAALDAASAVADGYLRDQMPVPLDAWAPDLTLAVCKIAAYNLMSVRGYNPEGTDTLLKDRHDEAMKWLRDVSAGVVNPTLTPPGAFVAISKVTTGCPRGW